MKKPQVTFILISCCTCMRPLMLRKSLESIKNLVLPEHIRIELLVIDNDKDASAKNIIEELQEDFPIKINYFVEEKRGISSARNRLLKESLSLEASHIALFDDDEIVDKEWLLFHNAFYEVNPEAIIISGPTYSKFEIQAPGYIKYNAIFKSSTTKKTGLVRETCASGNVFFPTSIMSDAGIYFSEEYVFMGGEDGDFFSKASKAGYTIVWNNKAINRELIGEERANIQWILERHYYNGYSGGYLKSKDNYSMIIRAISFMKTLALLLIDVALLPISMLLGPTALLNAFGLICKTKGKLDSIIQNKPINYYENICGN